MPIYEIEGKRVETDNPLSDIEIDEIASQIRGSAPVPQPVQDTVQPVEQTLATLPPQQAPSQETDRSLGSLVKGGLSEGLSTISLLGPLLDFGSGQSFDERMGQRDADIQSLNQFLGFDPEKSRGDALAAAGRAVFDPTTYAFAPLKGVGAAVNIAQSATGAAGAELATQVFPDSPLAAIAGGLGGSLAGSGGVAAVSTGVARGLANRAAGEAVVQSGADKRVSEFLKSIKEANPSFLKDVKEADNVAKAVTDFAQENGLEQLQEASPFLYSLLNTPKGTSYIKTAMQEDAMVSILKKELDNIKSFKTSVREKFKESFQPGRVLQQEPMATQRELTLQREVQAIDRALDNFDFRLASDLSAVDRVQLGKQLEQAIDVKEKTVRDAMSREYNSLANRHTFQIGRAAIDELVSGINKDQVSDIFGVVPTDIKRDLGTLQDKQSLNSRDIISLKNSLNRASRKTKDPAIQNKIAIMQERFKELRATLPPEFNQELKNIDEQYRINVGLPFGEDSTVQGIKGSNFFSDSTSKMMAKPEALESLIGAVGVDEAKEIYRKGMMTRIYDKAFKDDKLQTGKVMQIIKENREVMRQFPELEKELTALAKQKDEYVNKLAELQQQQKDYADSFTNGYFGIIGRGKATVNSVANQMIGPEGDLVVQQVTKDISEGRLSPEQGELVRQAIGSRLMDKALDASNMVDFVNSNKNAFDFALPGQSEKINNIAQYFSNERNFQKIINQVPSAGKNELEVFGVSAPSLFSTLRSKVMSPVQKAFVIGSKVFESKSEERYIKTLNALLTDPNMTDQVDRLIKLESNGQIGAEEFVKSLTKAAKFASLNSLVVAGREGAKEAGQEEPLSVKAQQQELDDILRRLE